MGHGIDFCGFVEQHLDDEHSIWMGALPEALRFDEAAFDNLWDLHPEEFHEIRMHGRTIPTPRWQQAYGHDYAYTGSRANALPVPKALDAQLSWAQQVIDLRLNGILCNWYDGRLRHYIGRHRDSMVGVVEGSVIVTISHGEERTLRFRRPGMRGFREFEFLDGAVVILPTITNAVWQHEVPAPRRFLGRRISVSIRAFER